MLLLYLVLNELLILLFIHEHVVFGVGVLLYLQFLLFEPHGVVWVYEALFLRQGLIQSHADVDQIFGRWRLRGLGLAIRMTHNRFFFRRDLSCLLISPFLAWFLTFFRLDSHLRLHLRIIAILLIIISLNRLF